MEEELTFPLVVLSRLRMGIDGQGVRTLVIGRGCPLHCQYCPNTFTWKANCKYTAVTTQQLHSMVKQGSLYYHATGGGITFGGGEPLLHAAFIREFCERYGDKWRIAVETSLNVPMKNLLNAMDAVDEFSYICPEH